MARIGEWIRAKAIANGALTALIGTRIHPIVLPQSAQQAVPFLDAISWAATVEPADQAKREAGELSNYIVEFRIYSEAYTALDDIDDALRALYDYHEGTAGGVTVTGAQYLGGQDGLIEQTEILMRTARYKFRTRR
jgi:hypothetical protein